MSQKLVKTPDKILLSKQKLINIGLLIVVFNPLPSGLIYGFFVWRQTKIKKEGKLIMILSLIWGAISLALVRQYFNY